MVIFYYIFKVEINSLYTTSFKVYLYCFTNTEYVLVINIYFSNKCLKILQVEIEVELSRILQDEVIRAFSC